MDFKKLLNIFFTGLNANLEKGFSRIVKAIDGIDVRPTIHVKAPEVKVPKIELPVINVPEPKIPPIKIEKYDNAKEIGLLQSILSTLKTQSGPDYTETFDAFGKAIKETRPKDEMKINGKQMEGLMSALTNIGGTGGTKAATRYTIEKVDLTLADTEYEYIFPQGTVSWTMKLRAAGQNLFFASATGKLPVSGDDSDYMTLLPGLSAQSQDNVEYGGAKMFLESDGASQVVELMIAQM